MKRAICNNTDGPGDDQTEWNKSDREREISYDITYMWDLESGTTELLYKTETDTYIEDNCSYQKGKEGEE